MAEEHVWAVLQVVAGAIIAKTLPVTVIAILELLGGRIAMLERPAKIRVALRHRSSNDGCLHLESIPAADYGHGVAQVAFCADGLHDAALGIDADVTVIVAAEAA